MVHKHRDRSFARKRFKKKLHVLYKCNTIIDAIAGGDMHGKQEQLLLVKIVKYVGFCVCRGPTRVFIMAPHKIVSRKKASYSCTTSKILGNATGTYEQYSKDENYHR